MRGILTGAVLLFSVLSSHGQRTIANISGQLSFPQGEYKRTYPVTGAGLRLGILTKPVADGPIYIGGELGFLVTSSDAKTFELYYNGFFDRYRVTASNNILSLAFKARADLAENNKPVQVFLDATIGTNLFFSSVDIERQTFFGGSQNAGGESTKGYWAFVFGPGAGLEIPLDKRRDVMLLLKGSYLFGSNTKYLTDPYVDNNGNIYFTERESKTDMVIAEAGLRFSLSNNNRRGRQRNR